MKTIEELMDEISIYVIWNNAEHIDAEAEVEKIIIDYTKQLQIH